MRSGTLHSRQRRHNGDSCTLSILQHGVKIALIHRANHQVTLTESLLLHNLGNSKRVITSIEEVERCGVALTFESVESEQCALIELSEDITHSTRSIGQREQHRNLDTTTQIGNLQPIANLRLKAPHRVAIALLARLWQIGRIFVEHHHSLVSLTCGGHIALVGGDADNHTHLQSRCKVVIVGNSTLSNAKTTAQREDSFAKHHIVVDVVVGVLIHRAGIVGNLLVNLGERRPTLLGIANTKHLTNSQMRGVKTRVVSHQSIDRHRVTTRNRVGCFALLYNVIGKLTCTLTSRHLLLRQLSAGDFDCFTRAQHIHSGVALANLLLRNAIFTREGVVGITCTDGIDIVVATIDRNHLLFITLSRESRGTCRNTHNAQEQTNCYFCKKLHLNYLVAISLSLISVITRLV